MSVAARLYRQLNRVRREYREAQIPLVGVVGFASRPLADIGQELARSFRSPRVEEVAQSVSNGFLALRQAQQQLQVLGTCEAETREALRHWFDLCRRWAHGAPPVAAGPAPPGPVGRTDGNLKHSPSGTVGSDTPHMAASTSGSSAGAAARQPLGVEDQAAPAGTRRAGNGSGVGRGVAPGAGTMPPALARRLSALSASLEEGALLVDRLYQDNHLRLEEFEFEAEESHEGESQTAGDNVESRTGNSSVSSTTDLSGSSSHGHLLHLPRPPPDWLLSPRVSAARRQLDELAAAVAAAHPALFPSGTAAAAGSVRVPEGSSSESRREQAASVTMDGGDQESVLRAQLEAISQVLFQQMKFRHEPIEWVYDGLAPALLPELLQRRKGIPLSLAVLYCCVSLRLGVAAAPLRATSEGQGSVSEGPAALHGLPPEVAARQAGRSLALAPPLDCWLVAAVASDRPQPGRAAEGAGLGSDYSTDGPGGDGPGLPALFVSVDRRGRVMSATEARQRYADLPDGELLGLLPRSPVELWAELAGVMRTAHTRRGESDLVAHWLLQVLALDHRSPEWAVMMSQQTTG